MPDATFTFRLDSELKTEISEVAKAQDRTAAQYQRAPGKRREGPQLVDERVSPRFELRVGHALDGNAPIVRLPGRGAARTHRDVLGAGDANHPYQPGRAPRAARLVRWW